MDESRSNWIKPMEIDKNLSNWIKWMTMDKIDKCG